MQFTPGHRARLVPVLLAVLWLSISDPAAGPRRYLVMPFDNRSEEPSLDWLGEALAMSLSGRLEALGMRTVSRIERLDALEQGSMPSGVPLTLASALRVASVVRAHRLVTGTFLYRSSSEVEVRARLIDLGPPGQIWEGTRSGTLAGIFRLTEPMALEVAGHDDARVARDGPAPLASMPDPPLPLYEIIVRGLQESVPEKRVAALRKGLEADSGSPSLLRALTFALFDAGLRQEALHRLDALDPGRFPDGWRLHLLRARILLAHDEVDGAFAALSRSVDAGESADAHLLLARLHAGRGQWTAASVELDLAEGLDPGHPDLVDIRSLMSEAHP
jgi:TolB-like protein